MRVTINHRTIEGYTRIEISAAIQNAAAVWNAALAAYIAAGSAGKIVGDIGTKTTKIEKTTDDNQALIISR